MSEIKPQNINKNIWNRLTRIYQQDSVSGAYLFLGPKGTGKLNLALDFVCLDKKLKNQRKAVEEGSHPDVVLVKPEIEEKKGKIREKQISIDQIKEALKMFSYFPQEAQRKFLVIDRSELLTLGAANSLLKTIEELSGSFNIILTASGEGGVLDTIRSRCQKLYFNLKSEEEIRKFIEKENTDFPPEADLENTDLINDVVFLSRGRVEEALKIIKDSEYREMRIKKLNEFRKALRGDLKAGFQIAHDEAKDRQIFAELIDDWNYYLASFLKKNVLEDQDTKLQKKIFQISKSLDEARETLRSNQNVNARLLLENFFVQIK